MQKLNIEPADRVKQVQEYYFSKKLREVARLNADGADIISLGIGGPDRMPPAGVVETLCTEAAAEGNHSYQPYIGIPALRRAFAGWYSRWYGVELDPDTEIQPLIGSKEGILHISLAFLNPGDGVLVPDPGYPTYTSVSRLAGAEIFNYDLTEENGWMPDFDALETLPLERIKLMWINYPHMPTGTPATKELSRDIAIEMNSMSKSHNMAGWRVGMVASNPQFIQWILKVKSNIDSGQFKPLMLAAVKGLEAGPEWYAGLNAVYARRRKVAERIMTALGCEFDPAQRGLFLWGRIPDSAVSAEALADRVLYDARVFITPGFIFGRNGERYLRISLCATEDMMEKALQRIEDAGIGK